MIHCLFLKFKFDWKSSLLLSISILAVTVWGDALGESSRMQAERWEYGHLEVKGLNQAGYGFKEKIGMISDELSSRTTQGKLTCLLKEALELRTKPELSVPLMSQILSYACTRLFPIPLGPWGHRGAFRPLTQHVIQHTYCSRLVTAGLELEGPGAHRGSSEFTEGVLCALKTHTCRCSLIRWTQS